MKLSIVILCWNDLKVIGNCLKSIYETTHSVEFEVIVSDNGSTDGSIQFIHQNFPQVRVIENGTNLRFSKANNVGIRASRGEYVLILNPDTIIHEGTLDRIVKFADEHPEAGAIGCRVLNADGSRQESIRPFPTIVGAWIAALYLRPLGYLSDWFLSDTYMRWRGETQREVDWLSGCFILMREDVLKRLGGFDEQFFYFHEDTDICHRVWECGKTVLYTPEMTITHLGGQSTKHLPLGFALDGQVTRYRYYYKNYGGWGVRNNRWAALTSLLIRRTSYALAEFVRPNEDRKRRLQLMRVLFKWHMRVNPFRLIENGEEPELGTGPIARVVER